MNRTRRHQKGRRQRAAQGRVEVSADDFHAHPAATWDLALTSEVAVLGGEGQAVLLIVRRVERLDE